MLFKCRAAEEYKKYLFEATAMAIIYRIMAQNRVTFTVS